MGLAPTVLRDHAAVGDHVARLVAERLTAAGPRPFLLGCPSGRTPLPVYRALTRLAAAGHDLARLVVVLMDEYLTTRTEPDGVSRVRVDAAESFSCVGFAEREILGPLAQACAAAGTAPPTALWVPDPRDPTAYDERLEAAGGVDLFLLASGESDGHVGFNQPGTARGTGTHVATLGAATRRDNLGTFPELGSLSRVPTHGVTVGVETIAAHSREVVMLVCGAHKRLAFARLTAAQRYESDWPATIVTECRNPSIVADLAAAS